MALADYTPKKNNRWIIKNYKLILLIFGCVFFIMSLGFNIYQSIKIKKLVNSNFELRLSQNGLPELPKLPKLPKLPDISQLNESTEKSDTTYLEQKIKCKELSDNYFDNLQKEMDSASQGRNFKQEVRYIKVDYSPKLDTCLAMFSVFNINYLNNGTFTQEFAFNTIHDLLGKYDSTYLLHGNDPDPSETEMKFNEWIKK